MELRAWDISSTLLGVSSPSPFAHKVNTLTGSVLSTAGGKGYRDLLGVQTTALVWSIIEASVAVIAASIPSIRRLLMDFVFKPHERSWMLPSGRNQDGSDSKGQETKYELGSLG